MNVIETERLLLRQLHWDDAAFILELLNEADFVRFIGDKGVKTLADARDYISKGPLDSYARHSFGLYLTAARDGTPLGICGLVKRDGLADPDIGFAFLKRHRAQGYAAEAACAVLNYGRQQLRLTRIVAICQADNGRSIGVLEKIGLQFERTIRLAQHTTDVNLYGPTGAETGT
jgi:ribosomal-protein-alanine N-acetyltransferase